MVFSGGGRHFAQDVPATVWLALACVLWCRFAAAVAPQPQRIDLEQFQRALSAG